MLPYPAPALPDKTKRMSLNEKKMVHTLMSCTGGIVYDEDPGCIVESSCISVMEREGEQPHELMSSLVSAQHTIDRRWCSVN